MTHQSHSISDHQASATTFVPSSPTSAMASSSFDLPYLDSGSIFLTDEHSDIAANQPNDIPKLSLKMRRRGSTRMVADIVCDQPLSAVARSQPLPKMFVDKHHFPGRLRMPTLSRSKSNQVANPAA